jgi:hypothetical protein
MAPCRAFYAAGVLLAAASLPSAASTITVKISYLPVPNAIPADPGIGMQFAVPKETKVVVKQPDRVVFEVSLAPAADAKPTLFETATIYLQAPPDRYVTGPVVLSIPFSDFGANFALVVIPTIPDGSSELATEIFATSLTNMDSEELFRFFWKARGAASARLPMKMENAAAEIYPRDIQVAFKLLEAARDLSHKMGYVPDPFVAEVDRWLHRQSDTNVARLEKAGLREGQVDELLRQMNELEAEMLRSVWRGIQDTPDCLEKYKMYNAFLDYLRLKPFQERKELLTIIHLSEQEIVLSQNQCLIDATNTFGPDMEKAIDEQITVIEMWKKTAAPNTKAKLEKDQVFFESVLTTQ